MLHKPFEDKTTNLRESGGGDEHTQVEGDKQIVIIGGGGHGKMCIDLLQIIQTFQIVGILDAQLEVGTSILGVPVVGRDKELENYFHRGVRFAVNGVGAGDNHALRGEVYARIKQAGFRVPNLIHPSATVADSVVLGEGNQVMAHATIGSCTRIGDNCIINLGAVVSHDSELQNNVHIAPGAVLGGSVKIGADTLVGMGVTVFRGLRIGSRVKIWNGVDVFSNVSDGVRRRRSWAGRDGIDGLRTEKCLNHLDFMKLASAPSERSAKRILLSIPHMGGSEMRWVQDAFATNWLSTVGPNLSALEKEFGDLVGLPSVALGSGTAGIHLGVKLLGLKPGDEMVTPTLTFAASCNPILYEGGVPVFVDSDRASWSLDPQLLSDFLKRRASVNRLPKAVTVVQLFGQCADMDSVLDVCRRYELPVLEDAAEALGARYKGRLAGTLGDVGVYSFNGNKIITCTSGGMLVSARKEWVDKARYWSTQARDPGINYLHSEVGYNYRLSNVLAGIARGQLEVLEQRINRRRGIAFHYRDALADVSGFELMPQAVYGLHTNWLSCFLIDEKKFGFSQLGLIKFLDAANIEARPVWKPMHTQRLYQRYECVGGAVAEDLNRRGICLPSSSCMSGEEQQFVIDRIREAHETAKGGGSGGKRG